MLLKSYAASPLRLLLSTLWLTSCEGSAGDTGSRGGFWSLWRISLQMMGLLLAGCIPLHKALTAGSFKGWVPPAVIFYSGTLLRKQLENVISLVIQINYRLNICMGSLKSWMYFLTAFRFFFIGSCSEDAGKYIFLLEILLKTCKQHVVNSVFASLGFFAEATY